MLDTEWRLHQFAHEFLRFWHFGWVRAPQHARPQIHSLFFRPSVFVSRSVCPRHWFIECSTSSTQFLSWLIGREWAFIHFSLKIFVNCWKSYGDAKEQVCKLKISRLPACLCPPTKALRTNGPTDRWTNRRTNGRTHPFIESWLTTKKTCNFINAY